MEDQVVPGPAHELAQGVEEHVGLVGREGQQQVAVALGRVEAVVGQERHPDQLPGLALGQPEAVVEQRRPDAEGDGQAVGAPIGPEDAGLGRRVGGVAALRRPGLHQAAGLVGEVAQALGQAAPVLVDQVEGGQQAEAGRRGVDAGLVVAEERAPAGPGPGARGSASGVQAASAAAPTAADPRAADPRKAAPAEPGRALLGGPLAAHEPAHPLSPSTPGILARFSDRLASSACMRVLSVACRAV